MKLSNVNRILIFCTCMILLGVGKVQAQRYDRYPSEDYYDEGEGEGPNSEVSYGKSFTASLRFHNNDCSQFCASRWDTAVKVFKAVTMFNYTAHDSTMKDKKFINKRTVTFNKIGEKVRDVTIDSIDRTTDSTCITYDDKFNEVRSVNYSTYNMGGKMILSSDEMLFWNAKGNLVKDSAITRNIQMSQYDTREFASNTAYYTYDDSDYIVLFTRINNDDTTIVEFINDDKKRTLLQKAYHQRKWDYYYIITDAKDRTIETKEYTSDKDTIVNKFVYDSKDRLVSNSTLRDRKLTQKNEVAFQPDGAYTTTEQRNSFDEEASCPENTTTVSVFSKDSLIQTETITDEKNGKPFVTVTKHIYRLDGKNVVFDSATINKVGDLYSSSYIQLRFAKFDAKGMVLEEISKGPSQYGENAKVEYRYNKRGNIILTENYGACLSDPFSTNQIIYYADDSTVKATISIRGNTRDYMYYSEDAHYQSSMNVSLTGVEQAVYEFVK